MRPSSLRDSGVSGSKAKLFYPRPKTGGFLKLRAYAKLNLYLDVVGKRPDGYHDIVSVMQTIDLFDELEIFLTGKKKGFRFKTTSNDVPSDESNLVAKAAKLMINEYKISESFEINLTKRIPVGAGLAGGSADGAAAIKGINELLKINAKVDELMGIAASLGADVPFCLMGGTCLAQGIGEILTPLAPHPDCLIVVAFPGVHVSTGDIFGKLSFEANKLSAEKKEKILSSFRNNELTEMAFSLYNVFTDLTSKKYPIVEKLISLLKIGGAIGASMTGTGSAVFGYFSNEPAAKKTMLNLDGFAKTYLVKPINRG